MQFLYFSLLFFKNLMNIHCLVLDFFCPLLNQDFFKFLGFISISLNGKLTSYILLQVFRNNLRRLFALHWVEFKLSQLSLPIWSLKKAMLFSLKIRFLSLNREKFCGNFKVLIEKKISKWSKRFDFIMPLFIDSSKIFVVMTLSVIVADFLATRVSLFIKAIAPYSNSEM